MSGAVVGSNAVIMSIRASRRRLSWKELRLRQLAKHAWFVKSPIYGLIGPYTRVEMFGQTAVDAASIENLQRMLDNFKSSDRPRKAMKIKSRPRIDPIVWPDPYEGDEVVYGVIGELRPDLVRAVIDAPERPELEAHVDMSHIMPLGELLPEETNDLLAWRLREEFRKGNWPGYQMNCDDAVMLEAATNRHARRTAAWETWEAGPEHRGWKRGQLPELYAAIRTGKC